MSTAIEHETALAAVTAAHRISSAEAPADILVQLAREACALARGASAIASHAPASQDWNRGIHVHVAGTEPVPVSPALRSAVCALRRNPCRDDDVESAAILRALGFDHAHVRAFAIAGGADGAGGVLVVVTATPLERADADLVQALCDVASAALKNAFRYETARRCEERLFLFSEVTDGGIWDWDPATNEMWWGGGIQKIVGGSGADVGATFASRAQRIHPDDRDAVRSSLEAALAGRDASWGATYRLQRADGSFAVVEERAFVARDGRGRPLRVIGHIRDVTELEAARLERRRVEHALARERTTLRSVFMNAPVCICVLRGPDHVFELANPPYRALLGGRDIEGLPVRVALPELVDQGYLTLLDRVLETGERFIGAEMPTRIAGPDGTTRDVYFDFVYEPIIDADGQATGIVAFGFEVTDQVLDRRRLEAALRLTDTITSNATLGLIMMDARQHCTFMNPAAEAITGFRLDEVQGRPLHDAIHHTRPDGTPYPMEECPIDRALPTRSREHGEDVFVHKDGHFYPVAFTASPILEDGKPVGTVIELADTTAQKAAERERERMLDELRAAIAARDEFLSIASHELRTPLTALELQLDSIARAIDRDIGATGVDKLRRKLATATRQIDRLTQLIEGLLSVSRIQGGRLHLDIEEVDLAELVRDVAERFDEEVRRNGSELRLDLGGDAIGRWDRLRLDQAVTNLISNAIKYGDRRPIDVAVEADDRHVILRVRDRGIGIASADTSRIFERFERAVSPRHYGGLGLGLYITRAIVEAHGGTIAVDSDPGGGSVFTVRLPRRASTTSRVKAHT